MKNGNGADAFLAFLAGAASGAALMHWLSASGWTFPGMPGRGKDLEARTRSATAASVGRIHAVLGEIRALVESRKAARAGEAAGPVPDAVASTAAAAEEASAAYLAGLHPKDEAWRRPDRIGYGRRSYLAALPEGDVLAAGAAVAAGAAAAFAAMRGGGSRAAWPAVGGFVAAAALVYLGRSGPGGRRSGPVAPTMAGPRSRRSRPAML